MGRNGTKGPPLQNRTETLRVIHTLFIPHNIPSAHRPVYMSRADEIKPFFFNNENEFLRGVMQPLVGQSIRLQRFQSQIYIFLGGGEGLALIFYRSGPKLKWNWMKKKLRCWIQTKWISHTRNEVKRLFGDRTRTDSGAALVFSNSLVCSIVFEVLPEQMDTLAIQNVY